MTEPMLILLPPSEGKAPGGDGAPWSPGSMRVATLDPQRERVMAALRSSMRQDATKRSAMLGVKGDALAAATAANRAVATSPTRPAIERYTGVLYGELDAASMGSVARRRLESCTLILSGLFGVVAPQDPIPDYKLKMSATAGALGRLSTWWREPLSAAVAEVIESRRARRRVADRVVWNLLPNEHAAALVLPPGVRVCTVEFLQRAPDGSTRKLSHWNKLHKGTLVRHLLTEGIAAPEGLTGWSSDHGYRLDPSLTVTDGETSTLRFVADSPAES